MEELVKLSLLYGKLRQMTSLMTLLMMLYIFKAACHRTTSFKNSYTTSFMTRLNDYVDARDVRARVRALTRAQAMRAHARAYSDENYRVPMHC